MVVFAAPQEEKPHNGVGCIFSGSVILYFSGVYGVYYLPVWLACVPRSAASKCDDISIDGRKYYILP